MKTPSPIDAIVIPLAGALVTGLLAGALAQSVGWAGLPVGLGAALVAWLLRPGAVQLPTLPAVVVDPPQPPIIKEQTVRVNVISDDGRQGEYMQFGIDGDRLRTFAAGLLAGRALTSREWSGGGGLVSQAEFARLRGELIRRNLARWGGRDPRSGCVLTSQGRAVMRGLSQPPTGRGPRLAPRPPEKQQTHSHTQ